MLLAGIARRDSTLALGGGPLDVVPQRECRRRATTVEEPLVRGSIRPGTAQVFCLKRWVSWPTVLYVGLLRPGIPCLGMLCFAYFRLCVDYEVGCQDGRDGASSFRRRTTKT